MPSLTFTNYAQFYSDFSWSDRTNYTYRRLTAQTNVLPLNQLAANSGAGPVDDHAGFTRTSQDDGFQTLWIAVDGIEGIAFQCTNFSQVAVTGASLDLYVHVNPPPPTTGTAGLPTGTRVHRFTDTYEWFSYAIPRGTTHIAFTLATSCTAQNWPAAGLSPSGLTEFAVFGAVEAVGTDSPNPDPTPPTHVEDPPAPTAPEYGTDYLDPFDPGATVPAIPANSPPTTQTMTILDAIRQFSAAVRRAVRLTSATSIEMVNPNVPPLPTGWSDTDGENLYHSSDRTVAASGETLRLAAGKETVAVTANLVTNDVRLITSDWQIPNQLPVYGPGLRPAPVKRLTYTMTPKTFTASIEFAYPAVPAVVRR